MTPRLGAPPVVGRRYTLRPGAYAILPRAGTLLLTYQTTPAPELQLPGGGIGPGESPLAALHREVIEETGWRIANIRRLGAFRRFTYMPEYMLWAEKLCVIYLAHPVRPLGPPTEADCTPVWMAPNLAARELGNPGDRHFVQRYCG